MLIQEVDSILKKVINWIMLERMQPLEFNLMHILQINV